MGQFALITKHVREGAKAVEKWNELVSDFTGTDWRAVMHHPWQGGAFRDKYMVDLA